MTQTDPEFISDVQLSSFCSALPFWISLATVPLVILGAVYGGIWVVALPLFSWLMFSILDGFLGLYDRNADPQTPTANLKWYRLITAIWFPVQFVLIFGTLAYVTHTDHLAAWERNLLFLGIGVVSGTIGINYAHELMHQKGKLERWMGDLLMTSVFYGHFRSEHLLVHHRYVGTPKDPVTARYNEGFHRFFPRVLIQCFNSARQAEAGMLARKGLPATHLSNPFWRYGALQLGFVILAFWIGGWVGLGLFLKQAFFAVWQLELVNYVEHYGLTRRYLGEGKYEHVKPRHSWNSNHKASNWLLINLQRHSDHHYKPDRRFPLLQSYDGNEAPQLPFGYPIMTTLAMCPPAWRRVMNPKVRDWRRQFYSDITDWKPYAKATNPQPR